MKNRELEPRTVTSTIGETRKRKKKKAFDQLHLSQHGEYWRKQSESETDKKIFHFFLLNLEISNQGVSANFSDCEKILLSVLGSGRSTCLQPTWSYFNFSSSNSFSYPSTQSHHTGPPSQPGTSSMPFPTQAHSDLSFNFNLNITPSQWSSQTNSPNPGFLPSHPYTFTIAPRPPL